MTNRQLFLRHLAQTSDFPLMLDIAHAEGLYLYGRDGRSYMDLIAGIGVSSIGHRHHTVVRAIKDQADKYLHLMVYGEYLQSPQIQLAHKLSQLLPAALSCTYFVNSGAEATEGALKLAKRYTGRSKIVSCLHSYHGSTHGALSVMGNEYYKDNYRPLLPDINFIRFGVEKDLDLISKDTACVIIETVQGEAGVRVATDAYFKMLRQVCSANGALLILDEIQTGCGRTGSWWAFEKHNIIPDILLLAKGLGGGMPIGAFISSPDIFDVFKSNPILGHITTFGGHPVSCAAAFATLCTIEKELLIQAVEEKEKLFRSLLIHPSIKEIRSAGLMIAVEFESFDILQPIINRCINNGVITDWFLHCNNSMRIAPPLTITNEEIKRACEAIIKAIE